MTWSIVLFIILTFPIISIWYIWKKTKLPQNIKIFLTFLLIIFTLYIFIGINSSNSSNQVASINNTTYPSINSSIDSISLKVSSTSQSSITPIISSSSIISDTSTINSSSSTVSTNNEATAKCKDNSYSFSLKRSGTCSHHGGVMIWYQ